MVIAIDHRRTCSFLTDYNPLEPPCYCLRSLHRRDVCGARRRLPTFDCFNIYGSVTLLGSMRCVANGPPKRGFGVNDAQIRLDFDRLSWLGLG